MIAANVMRRIRAGESRPGLVVRFIHAVGGILDPGFVLPAAAIASAALVLVVWQDPASIRASLTRGPLGPQLEASLEPTAVGPSEMDASRGGSKPRVTDLASERGRVFGAPAAGDFLTATKDSDPGSAFMQHQPAPILRVAPMQPRIVIQLEPMTSRGPIFHQDPLLAPRLRRSTSAMSGSPGRSRIRWASPASSRARTLRSRSSGLRV